MEYRHFLGPREAQLCILLDGNPGSALTDYVEEVLRFLILWVENGRLFGGPRSVAVLPSLQITSIER